MAGFKFNSEEKYNEIITDVSELSTDVSGLTTDISELTTDVSEVNNISAKNTTDNLKINDVIGNRTDNAFNMDSQTPTLVGHLKAAYYHIHNASLIYPRDDAPKQIIAGTGAWTEGTKVEIIPVNTKTNMFDIHHIILGNISANDDYVIKLYYDSGSGDTFWGEAAYTRDSNQVRGSDLPIQGVPVPANSKISASLLSASGGNNCYIKLYTHEYPN